jgi:hypothetical protein
VFAAKHVRRGHIGDFSKIFSKKVAGHVRQSLSLGSRRDEVQPSYRSSQAATERFGVSPTKVRKVPQDFCQQSGRKGFSANPELP